MLRHSQTPQQLNTSEEIDSRSMQQNHDESFNPHWNSTPNFKEVSALESKKRDSCGSATFVNFEYCWNQVHALRSQIADLQGTIAAQKETISRLTAENTQMKSEGDAAKNSYCPSCSCQLTQEDGNYSRRCQV